MATITIMDPVTRIEGHLKVELTIDARGRTAGGRRPLHRHPVPRLRDHPRGARPERRAGPHPAHLRRLPGVAQLASSKALERAAGHGRPPTRASCATCCWARTTSSRTSSTSTCWPSSTTPDPAAPWAPLGGRPGPDPRSPSAIDHFLPAVEARRRAHEMGAIFGGHMPLPHAPMPAASARSR